MSVIPEHIPFNIGTRVFISPIVQTGTVVNYDHALEMYEVRWVEPNKTKPQTDWFPPRELVEQFDLFGGSFDV